MAEDVIISTSLIDQLALWGDSQRNAILIPYAAKDEGPLPPDISQGTIFCDDFKRHIHTLSIHTKYELFSLAQSIVVIVAAPFCLLGEVGRLCIGSINASTCLKNFCMVPMPIIISIFKIGISIGMVVNGVINTASIGVGFLIWHSGERIIRLFTGSPYTVLSNDPDIRKIVYRSQGETILAAAAVFIPVPAIQMFALPIILGSIYGTLNNQFTVRECPEYYTMGHYYDGTDLKGHAIKTNNLFIKPIVTGCYATTFVTRLAGPLLAYVGTVTTRPILPVPLAGAMIAGTCIVALIAAHIFSTIKKKTIQKNLDDYAALIGFEWNETHLNTSWVLLAELRAECIKKKRLELASDGPALASFNRRLEELTKAIESHIFHLEMPVKYVIGWNANNTRNLVGYLFAGGGSLAIAATTIFLRIYVLR